MLSPPRVPAAAPIVLDVENLSSDDSYDSSDDGEDLAWFSDDAEERNAASQPANEGSPANSTRLTGTPVREASGPQSPSNLQTPPTSAHLSVAPSQLPVLPPSSPPTWDIMQIPTSDITETTFSPRGRTREEQIAINRAHGQDKRRETLQEKARTEAAAYAAYIERLEQREAAERDHRASVCWQALALLTDNGISIGEFLLFALDPVNKSNDLAVVRWKGLLQNRTFLEQLLSIWTSHADTPLIVRRRVSKWMVRYVGSLAGREARQITSNGWLRVSPQDMTSHEILSFSMGDVCAKLDDQAPALMTVMRGFSTTRKQLLLGPGSQVAQRRDIVLAQAAASLLREHSRGNNLVANQVGLYLYVGGAQRQTISVMSHLGLSCSYTALVGKGTKPPVTPRASGAAAPPTTTARAGPSTAPAPTSTGVTALRQRRPGILPVLSLTCMSEAQRVAEKEEHETTYDNLNLTFKAAEQIMGRKDSQENGTCVTLTPFHGEVGNALDFKLAEEHFSKAGPLTPRDILMSPPERGTFRTLNVETILWIIVIYSRGLFTRFESHLQSYAPPDAQAIDVHRTPIYPLQTMHIDESSIKGNVEVVDAIHKQLNVDTTAPSFMKRVRLFFGDQLTLARIRAVTAQRTGHEPDAQGWRWAKTVQGLFHVEMTATHNVLVTHMGKPNSGARNPASLAFHNTLLDRKPIVVTSLPPFRVSRDLVYVSLYARVLCCLLLVTGTPDLDTCAQSIQTWGQLRAAAEKIYDTFASTAVVDDLRRARAQKPDGATGDVVLENATLFMRDALILRTFSRLLKRGRSGHLILIVKALLLSFKGGGHSKYAIEMLHLLHNILHVWPKALRDLVLNNWLVNPTGTPDGFVSLDLMQEHLNFWIKRVYAAHGSNASWSWLATISPCIDLLRKLANHMNATLGSRQGKKHCPADLERDIDVLLTSLVENEVYIKKEGRRVDEDDPPTVDLATRGLEALTNGAKNTLGEFNEAFAALQRRNKVRPLLPFVQHSPKRADAPGRAADSQPGEQEVLDEESEGMHVEEVDEDDTSGPQHDVKEDDADSEPARLFSYDDERDVDLDPDNVYETDGDSNSSDADSDGELD